jgi:hypothetical protein
MGLAFGRFYVRARQRTGYASESSAEMAEEAIALEAARRGPGSSEK